MNRSSIIKNNLNSMSKSSTIFKKGHIVSMEVRQKISKASMGKVKHTTKHSEESKKKMRDNAFWRNKKPWNYIEDRTKLAKRQVRNDSFYKEWRMNVYKRDNFKCKINNGECSGRIIAHHILSWKDYPELRYEVNNGITLCHFHHPRKRNDEIILSNFFKKLIT